jgi:hypothetical protein
VGCTINLCSQYKSLAIKHQTFIRFTYADAVSDVPLHFTYPIEEQNVNTANYTEAVSRIPGGEDVVEARLFWDV